MTIDNFVNRCPTESIESIFFEINSYIFDIESIDLNHIYIDGIKPEANADKFKQKIIRNSQLFEDEGAFYSAMSATTINRELYTCQKYFRDIFLA